MIFCFSGISSADTVKDKYLTADAAYKKLRNNPKKMKYRDNWLKCIKNYRKVFNHDPSGEWAPAGLYKTGILYYELYKHSYNKKDKNEAVKTFKHVWSDYPRSGYKKKSKKMIRSITGETLYEKPKV